MSLLARALVGLTIAVTAAVAEPQILTLVVSSGTVESPVAFEELKRETARLVSPADYSLAWLRKAQAGRGDTYEQLVVVRFGGTCRGLAEAEPPVSEAGSLATTAVADGQVLPFVQLNCDRTRRLIAPALATLPSGARDVLFGRALGRVLAHELYHVLAQTTGHSERGVSKPCFRLADLVASRFQFDAVSVAQMRPALVARQQPVEIDTAAEDAGGR
jgi:hypothetical protein